MNLFEISGHRRNNAACNLLNVKCKVPSCVQNLLTTSRINAATRSHFFNSSILTFKIKPFQIIHTLTRKPFTQRSHTQAEQKKKRHSRRQITSRVGSRDDENLKNTEAGRTNTEKKV